MKKIDISQMISILANLGVIAGILFLGVELQQNNSLLRAQASQGLLQNRIYYRQEAVSNGEVADFWARVNGGDQLSPADYVRLRFQAEQVILSWQFEYGQYLDGNLSREELPVNAYRVTINEQGPLGDAFRAAWRNWGQVESTTLQPRFVAWFNKEILGAEE